MSTIDEQQDVSSAEITAVYRCNLPELSGDNVSDKLVSPAGRKKAAEFINKYHYPLVNRKISLCAGYCLLEATRLLATDKYDSCIAFASGFSLLTYCIAEKNATNVNIKYFDSDLPHMIKQRNKRLEKIQHELNQASLQKITTKAFDIENAYQQNLQLKEVFPECQRPIFIAEGISFFLSQDCVNWLFEQMGSYQQSAVIMNYWPDNIKKISALFARVFADLNKGMILETLKSFWDDSTMLAFKKQFPNTVDWAIAEVDKMLSSSQNPPIKPELTDPNQYFPLRILTGEKNN